MRLRTRGHEFELPTIKYEFNKRNFIVQSFFGQPFVKRFALCYGTVVCLFVCPVCLVCNVGVLWQTVG